MKMVKGFESMLPGSLDLEEPWYITGAEFNPVKNEIDVHVGIRENAVIACPRCGGPTKRYGYEPIERSWRHADCLFYPCYVHCKRPRVKAIPHKERTAKGEVYERNLFTIKDSRFKSDSFLDEVKRSYTDLINIYVKDDKQKLKVFDRNGVYLATKKIGKNNPKAEQIKADNQYRAMWNQTVDRALISGVPEGQILEVKQSEIGQKVKASIQKSGRNPALLKSIIMTAIYALELLIGKVFKLASQKTDKGMEAVAKAEAEQTPVKKVNPFVKAKKEHVPEMPKKSALASKYPRLADIYNKLEKQNAAIYDREQQLASVEKEFAGAKGIFKAKQRKELQEQAEQIKTQIGNMKQYLSSIVQGYGYKNVKEFLAEYKASKVEYTDYQSAVAKWEQQTGNKAESDSMKARLQRKQQEVKELNRHNMPQKKYSRDAR